MERLIKLSQKKINIVKTGFKRFLYSEIDWDQPLILIKGYRGTGKTTLLLQQAKELSGKIIYLSLDDMYFEACRLAVLVDTLYEQGYRYFFLDEVHRYKHWSKDLKNIYDNYPDIKVAATGSSILEVSKGQADLSRRAITYYLPGLSFREFLELSYQNIFPAITLETIISQHHDIAADYNDMLNIEKAFREYLRYGYYPFFDEGKKFYGQKLLETTNLVLDIDIAPYEDLSYSTVRNMKKLLYIIGQSVPFTPNISKISGRMNIPRNSILKILDLLGHARVISLLRRDTKGISYLQKPEKIYLQNTNLAWLLSENRPDTGSLRETFFYSQLEVLHNVTSSRFGDFTIDDTYTFEIGGPSKTREQIRGVPDAYIAADGIKGGSGNKIPLWLLGFLY
ncbi:MAG: ATP-binding protein [Bacteroidales bacterium]|nr:ATP-binding protein [Bacteroidales bacterium]